ncbi:MAG: hypothetical protein JXR34_05855 [Bacteroidales bacterium]|nr:hypothetical protein [Bacteroidales bacterium]
MIDLFKEERWLDLKIDDAHENEKFQISNFGRIRSLKVSVYKPKIIGGSWIGGYNAIVIKLKSGKSQTFYIHKLVAQHFIVNLNPLWNQVIHLDHDKTNNHYGNLKWIDAEGAQFHRKLDENYDTKKIKNSKLTESQVIRIKKMLKRGTMRPYRIAQQFGISQTQLLRIKNGKNWSHIEI